MHRKYTFIYTIRAERFKNREMVDERMYETEVLKKCERLPVFSLSDVNQIIGNRMYAKKFLKRMVKEKKIYNIRKNAYTLHADPFLVSTFLVRPSYISGVSALSYHKLITQIPKEVFCATTKRNKDIEFKEMIHFFYTDYFFGFESIAEEKFKILIATPEKAIIDSFSLTLVSVFEEAFENIDERKMIDHLKKIKKSSILKRIGYLMEKYGYDSYDQLKKYINYKYVVLDPLMKKKGLKNKKWGIIVNT